MKLYATTTSERASKGQGGNEYIIVDLNVHNVQIGQIELHYNADSREGFDTDEWVLQYRPEGSEEEREWVILAQGNVIPKRRGKYTVKGKRQKGDGCMYDHDHTKGGCEYHD